MSGKQAKGSFQLRKKKILLQFLFACQHKTVFVTSVQNIQLLNRFFYIVHCITIFKCLIQDLRKAHK